MARPPRAPRDSTIRIPLLPANRAWFDPATGIPSPDFAKVVHDLVRRTGGQTTDAVANATAVAAVASSTSTANSAGVVVPAPGGTVSITPANPLDSTPQDATFPTITVAQHTRTGAGAPILAGSVVNVPRGLAYHVWYRDLANAGGVVTFVANTSLATFDASLGDRYIGAISVPAPSSTSGIEIEITQ